MGSSNWTWVGGWEDGSRDLLAEATRAFSRVSLLPVGVFLQSVYIPRFSNQMLPPRVSTFPIQGIFTCPHHHPTPLWSRRVIIWLQRLNVDTLRRREKWSNVGAVFRSLSTGPKPGRKLWSLYPGCANLALCTHRDGHGRQLEQP